MNIEIHEKDDLKIAEIISDDILIHNAEDGLQFLVNTLEDYSVWIVNY